MKTTELYLIATIRPWQIRAFHDRISKLPGDWHLMTYPFYAHELDFNPRYIFFPHWSHKIPPEIYENYECIGFHETSLPFGRGGSPLQNLIAAGYQETTISAFRVTDKMDAGPIYMTRPLSLTGLAEEIYVRSADVIANMISRIIHEDIEPKPQEGKPFYFKRRTPEQSEISTQINTMDWLFDHIRMLDAEEYPRAYLHYGKFRLEFSRPALRTGRIEATVTITEGKDA